MGKQSNCPTCRRRVSRDFEVEFVCLDHVVFVQAVSDGPVQRWNDDPFHCERDGIVAGDIVVAINGVEATKSDIWRVSVRKAGRVMLRLARPAPLLWTL